MRARHVCDISRHSTPLPRLLVLEHTFFSAVKVDVSTTKTRQWRRWPQKWRIEFWKCRHTAGMTTEPTARDARPVHLEHESDGDQDAFVRLLVMVLEWRQRQLREIRPSEPAAAAE